MSRFRSMANACSEFKQCNSWRRHVLLPGFAAANADTCRCRGMASRRNSSSAVPFVRRLLSIAFTQLLSGCLSPVSDAECLGAECAKERCRDAPLCDGGIAIDGGRRQDDAGEPADGGPIADAGPAGCDEVSCSAGCCWRGACLLPEVQSVAACGVSGGACKTCDGGVACVSGQCVPPCGPENCSGCCIDNVCHPGTVASACGAGGGSCTCCGYSRECFANACVTVMSASHVGAPCGGATPLFPRCASDQFCRMDSRVPDFGYCTRYCDATLACPTGSLCQNVLTIDGGSESICLQLCWRDSCCSGGFPCRQLTPTGQNVCWIP